MSTPTTATATLAPHYNPQHYPHYGIDHHTTTTYQAGTSYRPTATGTGLSNSARLPHSYPQPHLSPPVGYSTHYPPCSLSGSGSANSVSNTIPRSDHSGAYSPAMPAPRADPNLNGSTTKKRRRATPNWSDFYKNGLPKEIIVIEDTPEPSHQSQVPPEPIPAQPVAKRRKRDSDAALATTTTTTTTTAAAIHHDPVYHVSNHPMKNGATSHHQPQQYHQHRYSPIGTASSSSGRTNSIAHLPATAPTSIGSSSSGSQYEYEAQPGQKRKRATRQQTNESKRQQAEAYQDILRYKTPAQPIKKSGEIKVKVIPEVRTFLFTTKFF